MAKNNKKITLAKNSTPEELAEYYRQVAIETELALAGTDCRAWDSYWEMAVEEGIHEEETE